MCNVCIDLRVTTVTQLKSLEKTNAKKHVDSPRNNRVCPKALIQCWCNASPLSSTLDQYHARTVFESTMTSRHLSLNPFMPVGNSSHRINHAETYCIIKGFVQPGLKYDGNKIK